MADPGKCADCAPNEVGNGVTTTATTTASEPAPTALTAHNALDPSTFVPPSHPITPSITIEFCDRCGWKHRASWTATELLVTFPPPAINAITLIPLNAEDTGGRFRVWLYLPGKAGNVADAKLLWDRKVEGGFPELKVLKQRIRDRIDPGRSLGHSDKK